MVLNNFLWDYSARLIMMGVNLAITGVLSRILNPTDYGVMGLIMAVTGIAAIFQDFGFSSAIVQKKEISEQQIATIFFLNWAVGILIYLLIFFMAPWLAKSYGQYNLVGFLRVSGLIFLISPINLVPSALIQKNMQFKQQALRNVGTTAGIGSITIFMAYHGWGVWSLISQSLLISFFSILINLAITKWRPFFFFNLSGIRSIFSYSSYLFLSSLLNNTFTRIDVFLIGKIFSLSTLGHYTRAQGMDNMVRGVSTASLLSVLFPYFARIQHDESLLVQQWVKYFNLICFAYFLLMGVTFISSKFIFLFLFGEQWLIAADYYKIIALTGFIYPLSALALSILEARGRSKAFFQVELIKKIIMLPCFFVAYYFGIEAFLWSLIIAYVIMFIFNLVFLKKAIHYSLKQTLIEFGKYVLILAVFLIVTCYFAYSSLINSTDFWVVAGVSTLFSLYYLICVYFLQPQTIQLVRQTIRLVLKRA